MYRNDETHEDEVFDLGALSEETKGIPVGQVQDALGEYSTGLDQD
jgi:hypothetical protein